MMFIDSDIGFDPNDVLTLLALASEDSEYDILCGPYPKKTIAWEKIKAAVDAGVADNDPNTLNKYVGDFVFNPATDKSEIKLDEPVEVLEAGTGFMMIQRRALDKMKEAYPQYMYKPDHVRTKNFDGTRRIMSYFNVEKCPTSERMLSEDYWFCQKAREIGVKVWLCPWMKTEHVGTFAFGGTLVDLAKIQASPTADVNLLKGKK